MNLRQKIIDVLTPKVNAQAIEPIGAAYPYSDAYNDTRLDAEKLLAVGESGSVDKVLLQVAQMVLNGRDMKIITPEDQNPKLLTEKSNKVRRQLWQIDKQLGTEILMGQLLGDLWIMGSGLAELGVAVDDQGHFASWGKAANGWNAPEWAAYLDAYSFQDAPQHAYNDLKYVKGRILQGIVYDIDAKELQYWQTQRNGQLPVQLPTGRILHLKDKRSRYPDGKSHLAGIAPTVSQLEAVRKAFMQRMVRYGVPPVVIKVNELREPNGDLAKDPFGRTGKPRFERAYNAAKNIGRNMGNSSVNIAWPDHEITSLDMGQVADITAPDEYLRREILSYLIPRDWIEQNGTAVSKSSTPLLELAMMVVHGWREVIAQPFNDLYTQILEANGYTDWACELTFKDPSFEDKALTKQLAVQLYINGGLTEDRLYKLMEFEPLTKDERDQLEARRQTLGGGY